MTTFRPETLAAIEATIRALHLARAGIDASAVSSKGGRDLVTSTDMAVEDVVTQYLSKESGIPVIGEERGGDPPDYGDPYWLVDPICGTRNLASGVPLFCTNLALVEDGVVTAAVVGDASRRELLVAERGGGAWAMNDGACERISTNDASSTVIIEEGKSHDVRRTEAARFMARMILSDRWDVRNYGSTVSLPYLAAGRVAAYAVFCVPALHAAAGQLLVTEAGGYVTDVDGHPWTLESDTLLAAANLDLYSDILAIRDVLNSKNE
jgi:myo-inositol-1(or 4)-monophosphatase